MTLELWLRKAVECVKHSLRDHSQRILEDSSTGINVASRGSTQKVPEENTVSNWVGSHVPDTLAKYLASLGSCPIAKLKINWNNFFGRKKQLTIASQWMYGMIISNEAKDSNVLKNKKSKWGRKRYKNTAQREKEHQGAYHHSQGWCWQWSYSH